MGLATLFHKNRLWAFVGSRVSSNVLFAWIAFAEIELTHRLRAGAWVPLVSAEALHHGKELLVDWALGSLWVGGALAAVIGICAWLAMRRWERLSRRTPAVVPVPTSESPPSAPPAPTP